MKPAPPALAAAGTGCTEVLLGATRFDVRHRGVVIGRLDIAGADPVESAHRTLAEGADAVEVAGARGIGALAALVDRLGATPVGVVLDDAVGIGAAWDAGAAFVVLPAARFGADVAARLAGSGATAVVVGGTPSPDALAGLEARRLVLQPAPDGGPVAAGALAEIVARGRLAGAAPGGTELPAAEPVAGGDEEVLAGSRPAAKADEVLTGRPCSATAHGGAGAAGPAPDGDDVAAARLVAACTVALHAGARVLRVADVRTARRTRDVVAAILEAG
ncbi:MAG: hypothetical protein AB7L84_04890 [Acidimicrobiia bacterium]